ncbi:MAG: chorismate synthase [Oscillospiraceae bacterium]
MSDSFGSAIKVTIFGESHGMGVGAVIDGLAAGVEIDSEFMRAQMEKRRAKGAISTQRHEKDEVRFLSGVYNGHTTGTALCLMIENNNTKSEDYAKTEKLLRPGHADYTAEVKYGGFADARGGGHFSGRLTAPIVAAGSIFTQLLSKNGVSIATHIAQCAGINDDAFSADASILQGQIAALNSADFAVLNSEKKEEMQNAIKKAAQDGDSVGGILETVITGVQAGIGEPFFGSVESELSALLFSIPAVKGVEFGAGFAFADMQGSKANDAFCIENGKIATKTNNNGGINGGIANGMPIILRTVIKPTPSIYKEQDTVDFANMENAKITINGRHDPCILHRARAVQDAMCAFGLADLYSVCFSKAWQGEQKWNTD